MLGFAWGRAGGDGRGGWESSRRRIGGHRRFQFARSALRFVFLFFGCGDRDDVLAVPVIWRSDSAEWREPMESLNRGAGTDGSSL